TQVGQQIVACGLPDDWVTRATTLFGVAHALVGKPLEQKQVVCCVWLGAAWSALPRQFEEEPLQDVVNKAALFGGIDRPLLFGVFSWRQAKNGFEKEAERAGGPYLQRRRRQRPGTIEQRAQPRRFAERAQVAVEEREVGRSPAFAKGETRDKRQVDASRQGGC